jgi:hypothetical protein
MTANYVVNFEILDEAGAVVSHGTCWSGEVADIEVGPGNTMRILDTFSRPGRPEEVTLGAGAARKQEYPALDEQIGVLWKVIANLPAKYLNEEAVAMLKQIAEVKEQYEKGAQYVMNDGSDPAVCTRYMKLK